MNDPTQIPQLTVEQAEARHFLSGDLLRRMHLEPKGNPSAQVVAGDGSVQFYYDPQRVREAPPEQWYRSEAPLLDPITLESGREIGRMSTKRAALMNYFTREI